MNERQAILHEVSKLSDEHCAPCKFNNTSNNNVCKFMCSIGKQLQDYGAELLGVNEIIPERVDVKGLSQRSIDTIRTDEYKAFTKLRESLTLRGASEQLGLSEQVKNHYNYVDIERYQKGVALDDEMIDRKTTKELAHEMSDKGLTSREIAEKLGVQIHTIYNYRTERRNRLNV